MTLFVFRLTSVFTGQFIDLYFREARELTKVVDKLLGFVLQEFEWEQYNIKMLRIGRSDTFVLKKG